MMRTISLLLFLISIASAMKAESVSLTAPGTLATALSEPATVTSLAVEGPVDASDFAFMAKEMPALATLDLSRATIAAYEGPLLGRAGSYPEATIPAMLMAGTRLSSIVLPASLKAIGEGALAGTLLTSVSLPPAVRTVGAGAFAGCPALTNAATGTATLADGAFAACTSLAEVTLACTDIPQRCFSGCTALATFNGAEGLTAIGPRAFEDCKALSAFTFGPQLASIGERAFAASGLTAADLSACRSLAAVGAGAFAACPALSALLLPDAAIDTGHAIAMGSRALSDVLLADGPVPGYALAGDAAADATAALSRATEVGEYALQGVNGATEVTLPAGLGYLADGAMEGMTGMRVLDASALTSVPELGDDVWRGVPQADVELIAADDAAALAFLAAGQWQEFKILSAGIADTDGAPATKGRIRAFFEGATLIVECEGLGSGSSVLLHDTAGNLLATLTLTPDGRAAADTSRWTERIYLVSARDTKQNTLTTIKIARNG